MADRIPAVAIAIPSLIIFLVLMPGIVTAGLVPRFKVSPKANKQLRDFFKDRAWDTVGQATIPGDGDGGGSNNDGQTRAPATTFNTYVISLYVGRPPQIVYGSLDVGSELVWVPCSFCEDRTNTACDQQAKQEGFYLMSSSESFVGQTCGGTNCLNFLPNDARRCDGIGRCAYVYTYGGANGKKTSGTLSMDEFTFGATKINVSFGCGFRDQVDFRGQPGVIGLNRGRFSLVTQLQLGRFSYYFAPEDRAGDSVFRFAEDAVPQTSRPSYTRFLTTGAASRYPLLYIVGLAGVRVGGKSLSFSGGSDGDGSIDAFLSTSVPVTYLERNAYGLLKQELTSTVGLGSSVLGLDMCYTDGKVFPDMALVFAGGAVMQLQPRNYLYRDAGTGLECLTILPSPDAGGLSLLGSLIQTGTHMIYDIEGSRLGFESFDQPSNRASSASAAALPRIPTAAAIACTVWCVVASMFL
uniref:Peptidase A1 domain-containing protein n=1 Tax=Oryza meridionalis TaxID=40149 RepID=A0A0E0DQY4_9ORYZ